MNASVIQTLLAMLVPMLTPEIKAEIGAFLDQIEAKAKATPNPYDDIAIHIIRIVTGL